jgi:hypothetical protein
MLTPEQSSERTALYQLLHALSSEANDSKVPDASRDRARKHERVVRLRLKVLDQLSGEGAVG